MAKISVIIPHYPHGEEIETLLKECVASLKGHAELVIVVNDGIGFAKACNIGLKLASGDYLCVVNNDTRIEEGTLETLAIENTVTVPRMLSGAVDQNPRAFYCMPRSVYEKVGGYDERFQVGYWEDDDFRMRLEEAGVPIQTVEDVKVFHHGGKTMHTLDWKTAMDENKKRFDEKWHR